MELYISSRHIEQLLSWAELGHPNEICGILWGQGNRIDEIETAPNVANMPDRFFEIDPAALIAAHRRARDQDVKVIGYYHSHPNGRAELSEYDKNQAENDDKYWVIIANGAVTAWSSDTLQNTHHGFNKISVNILE